MYNNLASISQYGASAETVVGQFGGKTLYRKYVDLGSVGTISANTWKAFSLGSALSEATSIINVRTVLWSAISAYNYYNLPTYCNKNNVGIYNSVGGDINGYLYVTIDYIKS